MSDPHRNCPVGIQHSLNDTFSLSVRLGNLSMLKRPWGASACVTEPRYKLCTSRQPTFYSVPWRNFLAVTRGKKHKADCHVPPNPELFLPGKPWARIHLRHKYFHALTGSIQRSHWHNRSLTSQRLSYPCGSTH